MVLERCLIAVAERHGCRDLLRVHHKSIALAAVSTPIRCPLLRRIPALPLVPYRELFAIRLTVILVMVEGRRRRHLFHIDLHVGCARTLNRLVFVECHGSFGPLRF